ncbi:hypothetical protein MA16_Dca006920 [Dendrobium catenatum]|uniref:Protein FAR1-RELATED SEQUENCE n=1 Tax=Dendrobium catenatum TaxID=906689 RepID=A0A2I0VT63_9ASPA|nr:hypothetical protein MA16_Dca006920 [Dendrobium catenatum]
MMRLLYSHYMRVIRQLDIINIPFKYLFLRWPGRVRKNIYAGRAFTYMRNKVTPSHERLGGMIFINHLSRFAYQISIHEQGNEEAEQYMLAAMTDIAKNVDLILDGKKKNHRFITNTGGSKKLKDSLKCRPKGISNARLKGHWENKKYTKKKLRNKLLHQLNNVHQWNQLVSLCLQTYQNALQMSMLSIDQPVSCP